MSKKKTTKEFIKEASKLHNFKYDYSICVYKTALSKVEIICKEHGVFLQRPNDHLNKKHRHGCPLCGNLNKHLKQVSILKQQNGFEYLSPFYNTHTKIKIKCIKHNIIFEQTPESHYKHNGCAMCINKSNGELKISEYLLKHNINNIREYTFNECRSTKKLPFDFYLPEYNICIEFDGRQHFKDTNTRFRSEQLLKNDETKTQYCFDKNIKLLRISYLEINSIDKILDNLFYVKSI